MVMATATASATTVLITAYSFYQPQCYSVSRPATIGVWDDYSCEYVYRTVCRDYQVCNS